MAQILTSGCSDGTDADLESQAAPRVSQSAGHARMVAALAEIARSTPTENPYLGTKNTKELKQRVDALGEGATGPKACVLNVHSGEAYVRQGDLETGIAYLTRAYELIPTAKLTLNQKNHIRFKLGVAYLRMGETENCCARNTPDSCILPIRDGGLHTRVEGSTKAIRYFQEVIPTGGKNTSI